MNLTAESYRRIRELLASEAVTTDTRLSINELSDRLGIGRSPVRDAINQLVAEGVVQAEARSGVMLKRLSLKGLEDITGLREALEPHATEQACARMDYQQHKRLAALCAQMRSLARRICDARFEDERLHRQMQSADRAFHQEILEACGNLRLQKIMDDHQLLLCKVQYPSERTVRHLALTLYEHWRIYRALRDGDAAQARLWMWRHARRGAQAMHRSWRIKHEGSRL